MAMATLCRPTMVPSVASCSNQSTFSSCEPPKACLSLAHSCTAFNKDLSLNTGSHRNGTLQQRISSCNSRLFRRSGRGAGATSIRAGLPVVSSIPVVGPLANAVLNPVLLFIVYAAGAFRFYSGFSRTTYDNSSSTKISMTALWPVLFVVSEAYRNNFKKAIQ